LRSVESKPVLNLRSVESKPDLKTTSKTGLTVLKTRTSLSSKRGQQIFKDIKQRSKHKEKEKKENSHKNHFFSENQKNQNSIPKNKSLTAQKNSARIKSNPKSQTATAEGNENQNRKIPTGIIQHENQAQNLHPEKPKNQSNKTQNLIQETLAKTAPKSQLKSASQNPKNAPESTDSKTRVKKPVKIEYPNWLNVDLFTAYIANRKFIKSPMSDYAQKLAIKKLRRLMNAGEDQTELIETAIENNWKSFYAKKSNQGDRYGQHKKDTRTKGQILFDKIKNFPE